MIRVGELESCGWNRVYDWYAFTGGVARPPCFRVFGELSVTRWVRNCGPFVWLGPRSLDEVEGVIVEGRNIELARRSH